MIPRVLHYCWYGRGEYPAVMRMCLDSWRKYCPDYEILEWNEDNMTGTFLHTPERADIPENIKEQLIVELYSK